MIELRLSFGEHKVRVELDSDRFSAFFRRSYAPLPPNERTFDLSIRVSAGYGVSFAGYDVEAWTEDGATYYRRADYRIELAEDGRSASVQVHNELALKHALMNLYSAYIIKHRWGLMIHSSCVLGQGGAAHLFAGRSGAGKSTAAALSLPRTVLSDEAALVKIGTDRIAVFHSPFRSELETDGAPEGAFPLRSVQLLRQAGHNRKVELTKADALIRLMDQVFCWERGAENTAKVLSMLRLLVLQVPAYELYFQKNDSFWELIS
ncbi:hypothetical protein FE782_25050 [Paenibacillus antri]|uniref:Uncharacterized protein n=1 Tax=Paenibacillus antri TaxID=2582848 RepID=A0A5R9G2Z5_9BACL|nr:hypothetical protein [Paenibacillus antri]TLS49389.1 hypothetical protein FE782_25050 [Paenibacillus antri]